MTLKNLIGDLVVAPLSKQGGLLQLHSLLLGICPLGFKFSLSVPRLILLVPCNSDSPVYHCVEVRIDSSSNESPQLGVKATKKSILLLLIVIHLVRSIAGQLYELMQVFCHLQVPLLEAQELMSLQLHHAVWNVMLHKQLDKVIPNHGACLRVNLLIDLPPC
jgi:hypothetical protein